MVREVVRTIAELPFHERPVFELLNLAVPRELPDPEYAGYGWARVERVWLATPAARRPVDDALVLALHSADDADVLADDIELYFELPGAAPVTVLASRFLASWLPRLPLDASAIVLALCNPHHAVLARSGAMTLPIHYAQGDVESWLEDDTIQLLAASWGNVPA